MNTFEITQSLNWYKSNVMTMDKLGNVLAYGSRSVIILVKGLEGNSLYDLQYNRLRLNTKLASGRIGALSFSNKTDTQEDACYLASIDEVNIYIWKVKTMVCEHVHSFGNKKNKNVTLLDVAWLYGCLTVVAMSDAGTLHKWDIQALTMRNFTLDAKVSPLTLAACPHNKNLIAIGCKNGHVLVYDLTGDGRIMHKLHYHERNVVSLTWCPVPYNPFCSDDSIQPLLLASTACDRTGICICRAGLDMFCETTVTLSMKPMRKTIFKNKTNLIWSCIKWVKPTMIVVTSAFGEIIKVDFQLGKKEPILTLISDSHKDVIFSIACSLEKDKKPYLWSSCMGRKLIRTPLFDTEETGELPLEVPTLGGFVYCFALSPVNSADFAFGLGDGKMYYWNVSNKRQLELITLSYFIDSKVLSLAFHPHDEGLLAFGSGDGRVGIFNLTKKKNNVNLLKTVLAHPIYRLCWAPPPNSTKGTDTKVALYAVGNGQIIIYNEFSIWKDPHYLKEYVQFNEIEDKLTTPVKRIEMAWKPDYDVVAIGNSNGSIYLLDGNTLKLNHVILGHEQSVECIVWHPTHVTCDYSEESKHKNVFASSSHCIRVHQLDKDGKPSLIVEFNGHSEKINELAWSPHQNLLLLSCSNDFTAKIWDVQKCTLIGVYSKHLCTVLCGIFSPLDPDIVFTGSADHSVHSWRLTKDLHNNTIHFKKNQDNPKIIKDRIVTKNTESSKTENSDLGKESKNKIQQFPLSSSDFFMGKYLDKAVDKFIESNYYNKMPVNDSEINYLAFFGTSEEIKRLLVEEYHALKKKSNQTISCMHNINMWNNNLDDYFKDAIKTKTIDDWMIAVAPSISYELWTTMCDKYATQLEDVGEITKASTYLIAIKKFKEAAVLLLKNNFFREALAVIKSQDQQDDTTVMEIIKKWAEYNIHHGHPKEAAHCYLSLGDVRNAISSLIKIKQVKEMILAAKLAKYIDEDLEESLIINILKTEYFKHHKWNDARELLKNHPKLNYLSMWIGVHEAMFELDPKITYQMFKNWICNIKNDNSSIIDYVLQHVEYKPDYYEKLIKIVESEFISDTEFVLPKMTVFIAGQLCLIVLQYQKNKLFSVDSQMRLIKCLSVAYNYESIYTDSKSKFGRILSRLVMWIFPNGPLANSLYSNFELNDNFMKTIRSYVCYTCFSWLNPLFVSLNKKLKTPVKENDVEELTDITTFDEIIELTCHFQQLFNKYTQDIMDFETLDYFKAKTNIEQIDKLLTSGYNITANIEDSLNGESNGNGTSISSIFNSKEKKEILDKIEFPSEIDNYSKNSLIENSKKCDTTDNKSCIYNKQKESKYCSTLSKNEEENTVCTNGSSTEMLCYETNLIQSLEKMSLCFNCDSPVMFEIEKCKKEISQFLQKLKNEFEKYHNFLSGPTIVKHVAHLEIEASKKKELENIVTEFEKRRINSPNPYLFMAELKKFIQNLDQF